MNPTLKNNLGYPFHFGIHTECLKKGDLCLNFFEKTNPTLTCGLC